ncbi:MAG: YtxH domain-containing protein [Bacteroidia bacterium]|jgi:gas vesicle protein|nr:YtxH domain-containing protein [Bacteroidia bacterium]
MSIKSNSVLTFVAGVLAGAGITWLLTSKEGKEATNKIKEKGKAIADDLANELNELEQQMKKQWKG